MSLYRGAGGASDATDDSTVNAVAGYASAAATSATNAATSATNASNSATAAATSASSAATSASSVSTDAANAANSATQASSQAFIALQARSAAAGYRSLAQIDAGNASVSASNAATSAASAATSATSAENSRIESSNILTDNMSVRDATLAIYGNTTAMNNAVTAAATSASAASAYAVGAATSSTMAASSAASAAAAVSSASSYADSAQSSANNAQAYATSALSARDATLAAYDSFDDRYLGSKSSDPTVDNDGNPLVAGSLYFNNQTNMMMLYAGGTWVAAYTSGGSPSFGNTVVNGTLQVTGNTTLSGGTANGVPYLNASKVLTTGSDLAFDGTNFLKVFRTTGFYAWGSGYKGLITDRTSLVSASSSSVTTTHLASNLYFDDTVWRYSSATNAKGSSLTQNNGTLAFYATAAAGSSGNVATTTTLFSVDNTGRGTFADTVVLSGGTANGVAYLNGSKVLTTGSALTFDGANLGIGVSPSFKLDILGPGNSGGVNTDLTARILSANSAAGLGLNFNSIWSIGTGQPLIFGTESVERMRLTSTGLGIGTSSPGTKLDVSGYTTSNVSPEINLKRSGAANYGVGQGPGIGLINTTDNSQAIIQQTAGAIQVFNYTTGGGWNERMRIDSSGNLGIGTTSPYHKLQVAGDMSTSSYIGDNNVAQFVISGATNSGKKLALGYNTTANVGVIQAGIVGVAASDILINPSGGNLGLGVTPSAWGGGAVALDVKSVGGAFVAFDKNALVASNSYYNGTNWIYKATGYATKYESSAGATGVHAWYNAASGTANTTTITNGVSYTIITSGNQTAFGAANNNVGTVFTATSSGTLSSGTVSQNISFTQAMTLDASGNWMVGGTSALAKATVYRAYGKASGVTQWLEAGDGSGTISDNVALILNDSSSGSSGGCSLVFRQTNSGSPRRYAGIWGITGLSGAGGNLVFGTASTDNDTTGPTERARIDSSGNFGLGVTPSAWTSGWKALDVGGSASLVWPNNNSALYLLANSYFDGTNFVYKKSAQAGAYTMVSGTHAWSVAASGTAGAAITFTQAMTLDASGNLLIGRTTVPVQNTAGAGIQATGLIITESSQTQGGLWVNRISSDGNAAYFTRQNVLVGTISVTGSATAYNTSSDYRLKNITGPITSSGAYIDSLNPVEGTWKADGSTFVGLIAHEVQEASRTQVATGVKDGEEMQSMDYSNSELIANMIAELKSLRARVNAAEAKLAQL